MKAPRHCAWCGGTIQPPRRRYCSEVCAYGGLRAKQKIHAAGERMPKRRYDYRPASAS